jgi:RNA polymerase sigma-70 factor (ECF subfamily)
VAAGRKTDGLVCSGQIEMSNRYDRTSMGGSGERFQTTCWTEILNAKTLDKTRRKEAINELLGKYWKPVYCYLRRKGYSNESAKDMTQGFFQEVVLGRELIQQANRAKGRFRTFLLTALGRYATDVYHKETAGKRLPKGQMVPLETNDAANLLQAQSESKPDEVFNYAWASEVLNQVLAKVKDDCCNAGREAYWKVFYAKVVAPIVGGAETPELRELCTKYGIESEAKVSNMIAYVKTRFRSAMTRHLRQFVQSDSEVENEFNEIFRILSKSSLR